MVLQIVLPEPNQELHHHLHHHQTNANANSNRHHASSSHRTSSRGDVANTRIYDINPGFVAGTGFLDPSRKQGWYRGGGGSGGGAGPVIASPIPLPITVTGELSFNSLCESRIGEDSLFSYGYG